MYFDGLRKQGFTQAEIDQMSKVNPARLLGWSSAGTSWWLRNL